MKTKTVAKVIVPSRKERSVTFRQLGVQKSADLKCCYTSCTRC